MSIHPIWATKYKRKGTELRFLNGKYYLYEVSSKWNPILKRSKKITGKLLGKITEKDGFIESNKNKLRNQPINPTKIYTKEYGVTAFLTSNFSHYTQLLEKHFPQLWKSIIVLAFVRLLHQSPIKNVEFHYLSSYLSEIYPNLKLSPKELTGVLKEIGSQRLQIVDFFKEFVIENDNILFDGTDLISNSEKMGINKFSKTKNGTYDFIDNIMFVFSVALKQPVYYRILPGNIKDIKAFKLCLTESGISNAVVIADKGFYSESNVEQMRSESIRFIIPLKRNNILICYDNLKDYALNNLCDYFIFEKRVIWYTQILVDTEKIYLYFDEELKTRETKDYLNRVETLPEKYTIDEFRNKQHTFGTIALFNNLDKSAKEVYVDYKSRCQIEIMIDALKNILDADKSNMQNEQSLEGWMFINHIALQWYCKILQIIKSKELNSKYSPMDLLIFLKEIRKVNIDGKWYIAEITKKTASLMELLNIPIT
jgi:transposase